MEHGKGEKGPWMIFFSLGQVRVGRTRDNRRVRVCDASLFGYQSRVFSALATIAQGGNCFFFLWSSLERTCEQCSSEHAPQRHISHFWQQSCVRRPMSLMSDEWTGDSMMELPCPS